MLESEAEMIESDYYGYPYDEDIDDDDWYDEECEED